MATTVLFLSRMCAMPTFPHTYRKSSERMLCLSRMKYKEVELVKETFDRTCSMSLSDLGQISDIQGE